MKNFTFLSLENSGLMVKIDKLTDQAYFSLTKNKFAPLFEDYSFFSVLNRHIYTKYDFTLPKIYTALYTRYGLHNDYDDYKCSFSYRFKLTVIKDKDSIFTYLLHIMDMKGNPPYFTFYRQLGAHELDKKGTYVQHVDTEFSKEDMREFMAYFVGNLLGTFQSIEKTFKKPFFRTVEYGYTIYGFEDGAFFESCYYREKKKKGQKENDYGHSDYSEAVEMYKNNPKMKGKMSKRYDWLAPSVKTAFLLTKAKRLSYFFGKLFSTLGFNYFCGLKGDSHRVRREHRG